MSCSKSLPVLFSGLPLVFLPVSSALADEEVMVSALDPIVVTATLGPKTRGESDSSVTVIDEEAIERLQPQTFDELLMGQPGIDITSNGSFGKNTSVYTRGYRQRIHGFPGGRHSFALGHQW